MFIVYVISYNKRAIITRGGVIKESLRDVERITHLAYIRPRTTAAHVTSLGLVRIEGYARLGNSSIGLLKE